ncbi:Response regulator PleD [Mucisphaera calidilacus]|uniref:Response regulator PleD n=2 Tax=Mucisphaera calidilacus TaxID=2527982 RepID=A0A518BZP1_9BACT|nr:Response regulator PleD [Mucisphaera calidilacus]
MAKPPIAGRVKTRLAESLGEASATEVHRLMLTCVLDRLRHHCPGRHVLALDGYEAGMSGSSSESAEQAAVRATAEEAREIGWEVIGQSAGDLGERLQSAWSATGSGPVAFFGVDSPDVPAEALQRLWEFLENADLAVGPAEDGGFWTLVAKDLPEGIWREVPWGGTAVFNRLWDNLINLEVSRDRFPVWPDVDDLTDLRSLLRRLEGEEEASLVRLRERLEPITNGVASAVESGAEVSPGRDEPDYSTCRVLLVDDNQQNLELLEAYLEPLGCAIDATEDGIDAIKHLEQSTTHHLPDLVLLDVMMPRMSGFEVCRKIKDDPRTRSIPVMMVTALHEIGDVEKAVECGTDDFLSKPVNKMELLTRAKSLLKVRHLKRELEQAEARLLNRG